LKEGDDGKVFAGHRREKGNSVHAAVRKGPHHGCIPSNSKSLRSENILTKRVTTVDPLDRVFFWGENTEN